MNKLALALALRCGAGVQRCLLAMALPPVGFRYSAQRVSEAGAAVPLDTSLSRAISAANDAGEIRSRSTNEALQAQLARFHGKAEMECLLLRIANRYRSASILRWGCHSCIIPLYIIFASWLSGQAKVMEPGQTAIVSDCCGCRIALSPTAADDGSSANAVTVFDVLSKPEFACGRLS